MRLSYTILTGMLISGWAAAQAPLPAGPGTAAPPVGAAPTGPAAAPSSPCAASAAMSGWQCPTCGHHGPCPTCGYGSTESCFSRLRQWLFYRPCARVDKSCSKCCNPCHPPLYAWFPCDGGCGSCAGGACTAGGTSARGGLLAGRGGLRQRQDCATGRCGLLGRNCSGQCGEFRFADKGKAKFLYADGSCGPNGAIPPAPGAAPPVGVDGTPPPPPALGTAPQPAVSYKMTGDMSSVGPALPAPPPTRRTTTYHPEAIAPTMPVLSPDQFRKPARKQE